MVFLLRSCLIFQIFLFKAREYLRRFISIKGSRNPFLSVVLASWRLTLKAATMASKIMGALATCSYKSNEGVVGSPNVQPDLHSQGLPVTGSLPSHCELWCGF